MGVPQGSMLGPTLFILHSADIFNKTYLLYADDTQVDISRRLLQIDEAISKPNEDLSRVAAVQR